MTQYYIAMSSKKKHIYKLGLICWLVVLIWRVKYKSFSQPQPHGELKQWRKLRDKYSQTVCVNLNIPSLRERERPESSHTPTYLAAVTQYYKLLLCSLGYSRPIP